MEEEVVLEGEVVTQVKKNLADLKDRTRGFVFCFFSFAFVGRRRAGTAARDREGSSRKNPTRAESTYLRNYDCVKNYSLPKALNSECFGFIGFFHG